jgi:quercetin dioxygenase-like cupin family protein
MPITDPSSITTSGPFVLSDDAAWETPEPGVTRQVLGYDAHLMLVRARFEPGAVGALHHHPHRQATYVSGGSFEVTVGGKTQTLREGDSFFVAPDLEHGVVAGSEPSELIDAFAPVRESFAPAR